MHYAAPAFQHAKHATVLSLPTRMSGCLQYTGSLNLVWRDVQGAVHVAKDLVRHDGFRGLYKGFATVIIGIIPARVVIPFVKALHGGAFMQGDRVCFAQLLADVGGLLPAPGLGAWRVSWHLLVGPLKTDESVSQSFSCEVSI